MPLIILCYEVINNLQVQPHASKIDIPVVGFTTHRPGDWTLVTMPIQACLVTITQQQTASA